MDKDIKTRTDFIDGLANVLIKQYGLRAASTMTTRLDCTIKNRLHQYRMGAWGRMMSRVQNSDCYMKKLLVAQTWLNDCEIPQELTELKRVQITLKRLIKEAGNGKHKNGHRAKERTTVCI